MKSILLASAFALAALTTNIVPASAETIIIRDGDHRGPPRYMHRMHPKRCITERKVRWAHGKRIVIERRVCR